MGLIHPPVTEHFAVPISGVSFSLLLVFYLDRACVREAFGLRSWAQENRTTDSKEAHRSWT